MSNEINRAYGAVMEGVFVAGFTFERATKALIWLLQDSRFKACGFDDVNKFLATVKLDTLKPSAEARAQFVKLVKDLQPEVSNRAIASVVGVNRSTIDEDARRGNPPPVEKKPNDIKLIENQGGGNPLPTPSGAGAQAILDKKQAAAERTEAKAEKKEGLRAAAFSETGPFDVVVIDPPWAMEKIDRDVRPKQAAFDYPVMTIEQIANHWIDEIEPHLKEDCHLFCWTTQRFLPETLSLLRQWGFRYVLTMIWHKSGGFQPIGLPQYNCEFAVYARKGSPLFIDTKNFNVCNEWPRREHSRKPDEFYDLIRRVTGGSRIDVFARGSHEGFAAYGNEIGKFDDV